MAAAVLKEEELQHSMATSEEDAEFEEDDELATDTADHADDFAANNQLHNGILEQNDAIDEDMDEEEDEDQDEEEDEEMNSDEDAEGESEDEATPTLNEDDTEGDEDEDEGEDEEAVGAVKIQPKALVDEDEDEDAASGTDDDEESVASIGDDEESKRSSDAEAEEAWAEEAEGEEDDEPANPNRCIFCQQVEEEDPSEEFESYLACGVCGDNAHQQCARNAEALKAEDEGEVWYCPDCVDNKLVPEIVVAEESLESRARRISRDRIADDLLPPRGSIKPDSHSVFNVLISPDDPLDGSRHLRKRKTSSGENEAEDAKPLPRRTRDKKNSSNQSKASALEGVDEDEMMDIEEESTAEPLTNGNSKKIDTPARASRSLRPKSSSSLPQGPATITEKSKTTLKVKIKIDPLELDNILSQPPKPKKKKSRPPAASQASAAPPTFAPAVFSQPFYSLHDKEVDELKSKPYGGILNDDEADTTLTLPKPEHRRHFDEARQKAEEEWNARAAAAAEAAAASGLKKARKVSGPASQIEYIEFGQYQIDIWYAAPYPEEYSRNKALFICEFCLKYMESDIVAWRHKTKCPWKHPPGDEIYREGQVSIFEVDGRKNPLYCQNLCLLAKLFLGSKTLYYDVEPFLFYVMTEYDELGCHFVGYFSKEKRPSSMNNVSCILVLPIHQRKGYGHLLIDFSYLLTRVEKKIGSPEKPLSDMGLVSYRNYWRLVLCYYLRDFNSGDAIPSIRTISNDMGLTPDDVVSALDALGALIRDPVTGVYAMKIKPEFCREVIRQHESKGYAKLNEKSLVWTPFVMGRGNASAFEFGPPLGTVAPRDDDEDDEGPDPMLSKTSKRDFETFNSTNGDADTMAESFGMLSTEIGDSIHVGSADGEEGSSNSSSKMNGTSKKLTYYEAAATIPVTRFEVFPPLPGSRARSGARGTPSRPKASTSASARPAPRSSSSRRSSAAHPRSASTRRRSGGTGRGPGRWPKGTKKADFGNAESGPGLPPRLVKQRSKLGHEVTLGDAEEEDDGEMEDVEQDDQYEDEEGDEIMFETPAMRKRRNRDFGRGQGLGKPLLESQGEGIGKGKGLGKGPMVASEDEYMDEAPPIEGDLDMDAEGEDE